MSTYQAMTPAVTDDLAIYPSAVAVEPPAPPKAESRFRSVRRQKGPQFYKPFHYLLLVYLFFYCSRIPEMVPWLHIGLVLQPILLVGMFMTGMEKALFRTDIGRLMTAFTVWVAICVPFSVWKGGSFQTLQLAVQALALLFFMAAFVRTLDDCYRVIVVAALAMAAVGILSVTMGGGRMGDPRLGLGANKVDTLSDANFLALYLVLGLPLLWFASSMKSGIMKFGLLFLMIPVLVGASRTGSRMGLLAMAIGVLFFFIHATSSQRATLVMGGTLFLILAAFLLPQRITERFTTFFEPQSAASVEAAQSAEARKFMLIRSLELTAEHPLFGVGPGEFMDAEAGEALAAGKRPSWHYTHNSFTELSSETGLLGLALFLIPFYRCFRGLTPVRDRFPSLRVRRAAMFVQMTVLIAGVGAFFLSIAYSGILYVIMGLSCALQLAAMQEYRRLEAAEAALQGQEALA
ncbi:MAG TPA: O-antigen ligase family protein [Candidatus Binatia bacterium]|nr:O-antigen ligase family protein [Candidatus Binatia bacterium]